MGKVRISVWETDDGRYIAQIPEKEYIISEEEFEEINTANQHLIHRIKDKIANTDYQNIEMEEWYPRWREYLGKRYLNTDWYPPQIQDIWNPEIWHPISYEEYIEIGGVNEKYQLQEEKISNENLSEKWINDYIIQNRGYLRGNYRNKLYTVLSEHQLTLQKIPEYLKNLPVKSNNNITKREEMDIYEQKIVAFFKKYKNNSFEKTYVPDSTFIEIEGLIEKGNFDTDKFLDFSEQLQSLQKRNYLQFHKRIYRYGYQYGRKSFRNIPPLQKKLDTLHSLCEFFKKGYSIQDLWDTQEHFMERLRYSLKLHVMERLKHSLKLHVNEGYYYDVGYYKKLWLTSEEIETLKQEAKAEWKDFFLEEVNNTVNLENDLSIFLNKEKTYKSRVSSIERENRTIQKVFKQIAKDIYLTKKWGNKEEYGESYRDELAKVVENYILDGIQRIRTKERIDKLPYNAIFPEDFGEWKETYWIEKEHKSNRDIRYVYVLDSLIEQKITLLKSLETEITQYNPEKANRYDERQTYKYLDIQEYLESYDHKKEFIAKRVQHVLSENLTFQSGEPLDREKIMEELSPKILETSKTTFYELLLKETKKSNFYYPVSFPQAMKYAKLALFIPGYATTLKQLYPNDEERTSIRQKYIQTITKELLLEIQQRLLWEEDFVWEEYRMRNALLYVYKRYWGEEDFSLEVKSLNGKVYQYEKEKFKNIFSPLQEKMQEKSADPYQLYKMLYWVDLAISNQTFFFLKNSPTHLQTKPKKWIKKEREKLYHSNYKEEIASQLSPEIQEIYTSLWEEFEEIKLIILREMANQRAQQNFAGRIKRMIEQTLQKKFWTITGESEQIDFMYSYLWDILEQIMVKDIRGNNYIMYPEDIEILKKEIIQPAITRLLETKSLPEGGDSFFLLWEGNIRDNIL